MALISYPRRPLVVLPVGAASPEEILDFLNLHGGSDQHYELTARAGVSERAVQVRSMVDRATVVGLLPGSFLVHDPELGGVQFIYDLDGLRHIGIDPQRLQSSIGSEREEN